MQNTTKIITVEIERRNRKCKKISHTRTVQPEDDITKKQELRGNSNQNLNIAAKIDDLSNKIEKNNTFDRYGYQS